MKNNKPILLIEDDLVDALTVKRAFKELNVKNKIIHKPDGEQALDLLTDKSSPLPCMILLDLNMPRMNGLEFIEQAKSDLTLRSIPIIVLTTSSEYRDKEKSFEHSVAGYLVKPLDYTIFVQMIKTLSAYWTVSEML